MKKTHIAEKINAKPCRSAWDKAVKVYALELLEDIEELDLECPQRTLLNGAHDWLQYSEGGCALIYDGDIAERVCTPSEIKRTDGGRLQPNGRESWLDVQARALAQAARMIQNIIRRNR